jgi:hypothetical protein
VGYRECFFILLTSAYYNNMLQKTNRFLYDMGYKPVILYKNPRKDIFIIPIGPIASEICFSYEFLTYYIVSSWLLVINN